MSSDTDQPLAPEDKAKLLEAWKELEEQIVSGGLKPENEQGEQMTDLGGEYDEEQHGDMLNPSPSLIDGSLPAIDDDFDDDLDELFEQLEELELDDSVTIQSSKPVNKGLKKGFLLGDNSAAPKKGILKPSSSSPSPEQQSTTARVVVNPDNRKPIQKSGGGAFTGQVVERAPAATSAPTDTGSTKPPRVSKFKQQRGL